jgi:hypothetical protein
MGAYDSGYFDDEGEERGGIAWGEHEWQRYLNVTDKEALLFFVLYQQLRGMPGHLDVIAKLMKWDGYADDSCAAPSVEELQDLLPMGTDEVSTLLRSVQEALISALNTHSQEPYTLHRHPGFVVTRALLLFTRKLVEFAIQTHPELVAPGDLWRYAQSLNQAECHATLAFAALDNADLGLGACHLKNALGRLNEAMTHLELAPRVEAVELKRFFRSTQRELFAVFFDLREVWLRLIQSCREEMRSLGEPPGEEN